MNWGTFLATEKNKKPIVTPHEVTISNFTIGFSVVDLVGNEYQQYQDDLILCKPEINSIQVTYEEIEL